MSDIVSLRADLRRLSSKEKAKSSASFFKTGPGQYADGDLFIGVAVQDLRKIAKRYISLGPEDVERLLLSKIHEERFVSLIILVDRFRHGDEAQKKEVYDFYLGHSQEINNWDLVDGSAWYIVGGWLHGKDKTALSNLAKSNNLWERRIAIVATFYFIMNGDPKPTLKIASILVNDKEDLIQKAVGWMLREVGKRCSQEIEEAFLITHNRTMPRTMLRYAIERFPEERRLAFLNGI